MKKFIFILSGVVLAALQTHAQNSLNSGDFVGGSWGTGQAMSASAGTSLIITKTVATSGDKYFRFYGDGSPCGEYQPTTNGDFFTHNVAVTTPNGNCGFANAWRVNMPTASSTAVFKTDGGNDGIDRSIVYVIQGAVQSVSSVAQSPVSGSVFPGQAVTVTATLSGAFATGQGVYLRYTTNGFTTSTVVTMTGSGTSYSATIPASANTPGASVAYYVFTSGSIAPASNGSDADFSTINLNNNGGSNYTYTVASGWTTAATGNWTAAATWTANAVPPTAQTMGTVTINHSITQDANAIASSVVIGAGGTLTATANTLTVSNNTSGTTFTNSGSMALSSTHTVAFSGTATHTVSGTTSFNNVSTTTGVNFGASSTVNGSFTINAGGFVSTNAPTYGGSSTLVYNTGAAYAASTEWTSNALTGQGVPFNVSLTTASTSVNFGASTQYRRLRGSLSIAASTTLALSTASGGDLRIGGNWTNSGTFTANSRAVFFDGSTAQTINATATNFPFLFISNTTADVTAAAAVTVTSSLTIDAGARLNMGTNTLTITGTTSTVNGFLRSAGTITGATTTSLTFSSTGTYEHNQNGGGIPTATWSGGSPGSTCAVIGWGASTIVPTGLAQSFFNFTWNSTGQSSTLNMGGNPTTINGNFSVLSTGTGILRWGTQVTASVAGNLIITSNGTNSTLQTNNSGTASTISIGGNLIITQTTNTATLAHNGTSTTTITFNKASGSQTFSSSGTISGPISWNVGTGSSTNTVQLGSNINLGTGTGTFTSAANAATDFQNFVLSGSAAFTATTGTTLISANTAGINTAGGTGSVQVTGTKTFTNAGVNYTFNAGSAQNTGTAVGAASNIRNLVINNGAGVTLGASATLSATGTLTFTSGLLDLSTLNLTMTSGATTSGVTSARYVRTSSTGRMLQTVGGTAVAFPVGNSAYNPITLTNSGTSDVLGIRVVDGSVANANDATKAVNRAWVITEAVAGGSTLSVVAQYNTGEEGTNFNAGTSPKIGFWKGSSPWTEVSATLAGSNPFTATSGATISPADMTTSTQYFAVGKDDALAAPVTTYTWTGTTSTDWATSTNWSPNGVPGTFDNVVISSPGTNTLSINSSRTVNDFTVSGTGTFTTTSAGSLTITGTVTSTTSAGVTLDCASTVSISNATAQTIPAWNFGNLNATGGNRTLASSGTIGICGTFTPGAGTYTVTGSTVNFNGTGAQTINVMTYNNLTISGNRGGAAITLPSGTINVLGNGSSTASNNTWVNTGNTVNYSGTGAQSVAAISGYNNLTISGAKGGATVTLEAGTIGVAGTFTASATSVTYSSTGNTFDYTSAGAQTITAFPSYNNLSNSGNGARTLANGTIGVGATYTPTTAAITVGTSVVNFYSASSQPIPATSYNSITNTGNGDRVWASTGNIDIAGSFTPGSGTHTVTGSTVRFINTAAGPTTIPVVTTPTAGISYNNVVINGTNGAPSVHSIFGTTVGIGGNLTITAGTLRLATTANSGTLNVYGTLTLNGGTLSLTNSGNLADAGTLNLFGDLNMSSGTIARTSGVANATINFVNASGTQNWTYSGGSFSILSGFGIPVNVGNGTTTNTLQLASNVTASSITLTVLSGASINFGTNIFTSTGSMAFAASSGSNVITANTGGLASSGASGSVQSTGSRTYNTAANYTFNGSSAQITGTGFTGANNLTINNSAGVTLSASATVSGVTTLTSGVLALGANNLTVTNTAAGAFSGAGSSTFIQTGSTGELRRSIPASIASSTTFDFPVGTSTNYTPASFTFTATGNAFTLHTRAVAGTHPSMDSNGTQTDYFANRYWVTNTSGSPNTYSYSSQFTHISGDAQGTVANIRLNKWSGSWAEDSGSSATSTVLSSGSLNETSFSLAATAEWTGRVNPTIQTYTWTGSVSGDWSNPNNWSPNSSVAGPTFIDNVIIDSVGTNMLSLTASKFITNFTLSGTGNFTITAGDTLSITGALTSTSSATPSLDCASTLIISNTSAQTIPAWDYGNLNATGGNRTLASSGTISICGTFTPGAGTYTVTGSTVNFNGTGAQTVNAMSYNNLTISQNRGGATLTLASGTISIAGTFTASASNYTPSYTGNTIDFSGTGAQSIPAFTYNNITNTGNAARTWASSGTIDVNGSFTPGSGTHTTTGSTVRYSSTAATGYTLPSFTSATANHYNNLEFVGGASTTWVLASGFSPSLSGNLTLSGAGTFTVATNATANNMTVGGNLLLSGSGTLRVANTATAGLVNSLTVTGNTTISSGVLNLSGSSNSTTVQGLLVTNDLTISGTGQLLLDAANNTALGAATVNGNFNLTSTTTNAVNFGSGAGSNASNLINVKGNFSKSGTGTIGMTGGFATTAGFNFNGTGTQTWSHSGTAMTGGVITVAAGSTLQLLTNMTSASSANTNAITVTGTLDCSTFAVAASNATNTFVLSGTGTLKTASASGVAGAVTGFTAAPTFTTGATFEFSGTNPSTGFNTFTGITTANAYTINWTGSGNLTLDKAVQLNALNLTSAGHFLLGNFDATITSAGTIGGGTFSNTRMVVTNGTGRLIRSITSAGVGLPFTWPIGETTAPNNDYSPVTINSIASAGVTGSIGFLVVDGTSPNNGLATSYLSRYWPCTVTGFNPTYTLSGASFTYDSANDVVVGPEASLKVNSYSTSAGAWTEYTSSVSSPVISTSSISGTSMPSGATYDVTARIDVPVYYRSITSGTWASTSTWEIASDVGFTSPIAALAPPTNLNSAGIFVRNGHTVTVGSSVTADDLTINSGGILNVTAGTLTIANGAAATDVTVDAGGTLQASGTVSISITNSSGAVIQVNGLMKNTGANATDVSNSGTINIGSSATYEHARNAGILPTCVWASGSTCLISGVSSNMPTGLTQSFHHFTVNTTLTLSANCSGNLQTINGKFKVTTNSTTNELRLSTGTAYTLTVGDSLIINNGFLSLASGGTGPCNLVANGPVLLSGTSTLAKTGVATSTFTFNNNLQVNAGSTFDLNTAGASTTTVNFLGNVIINGVIQRSGSATSTINFVKSTGTQTLTFNGTNGAGAINWNVGNGTTTNTLQLLTDLPLSTSTQTFTLNNNATLDCQDKILSGNNTTFSAGTTLTTVRIGSPNGITDATPGASAGNLQFSNSATLATRQAARNVSGVRNFVYSGTVNQVTGNLLPLTLATGQALSIANTGSSGNNTVTLTTNNTTTPTLNLQSGLFAAGTGQNINISTGGVVNATGGDFATGATAGRVTVPASASVAFNGTCNPYDVYTSGGLNFGAQTVTIQNGGTFRINAGGFVSTNGPFYASGSTLQYNVNTTYNRGLEWSASSGRGYPHHVQLSNNTTLSPARSDASYAAVPLRAAGNLTIDANSSLYCDLSGNNMTEDLIVAGNVILNGNLSGSGASGSDIYVGGNWQNDGTSTNFYPNNRAVFFNGSGTQTISGTNSFFPTFPFVLIDKTAGSVVLARDIQIGNGLTFTATNTAIVDAATYTVFVSANSTTAIDRQGLGHIKGNLRRAITTGSNTYVFHVGDGTVYSPASLALNNVTVAGSITAAVTNTDQTQLTSSGLDNTKSVNRFWTLSSTGLTLTSFDPTFTFVAGDLDAGVNTSNLLVGRYNSGWTYPTIGTRTATTTQATGVTAYGDFALAECKQPTVYAVTGGGSYCAGGSGVAVGLANSEAFVSYQLQVNGNDTLAPVLGTGSAISFGNQTSAGIYTVIASNLASFGCQDTMSGSATVSIIPTVPASVTITASPSSTICTGSSVTFEATPQYGGLTPSYQWKVNGSNVGTNDTLYTTSSLVNGDIVTCVMTSSETCPSPTAPTSNAITMTVLAYQVPVVTIAASPGTTSCGGEAVTFTATPTFGGGTPIYQWQLNGSNVGSNSDTYVNASLSTGNQVRVIMTSDYQCLTTPVDTSNVLTMTVTAAPQVDAGTAMSTCGGSPYLFANGASNSNTSSLLWTHNGAGSISGATTLTPTYTPSSGEASTGATVTFTLTGNGNSPCGAVTDQVVLTITPLLLYYVDADGDGFGNPLSTPIASCSLVAGRTTDNTDCCDTNADINPLCEWWADMDGDGWGSFVFVTGCVSGCSGNAQTYPWYPPAHGGAAYTPDCNDNSTAVYPGAPEICQNSIDNDCDGTIDEGCSGIPNDTYANAQIIITNSANAFYPNCQTTSGTVVNADISAQANPANVAAGGGRDVWFRFTAVSTAAQIKVTPTNVAPSNFNPVIELRTAAHPVGQVEVENLVGNDQTEIMNVSGLTIGLTYYVAVRNFNNANVGNFTICVSSLMPSGCAYTIPAGGFNLCNNYKAIYRGATSYTFNFTGTGGTAPLVSTSASAASGLIALSNPGLALRWGGVYTARVDANYTLLNGAGTADPTITILGNPASANCTGVTIMAQPLMTVRSNQICPTILLRTNYLIGNTTTGNSSVCSATSYTYRFTQVTNCSGTITAGLPFEVTTPGNTPFLMLAQAFPTSGGFPMPNLGYWRVEIRPNFSYGQGSYGPASVIQVNNTSLGAMLEDNGMVDESERSADIVDDLAIYPNPNNGEMVNVNLVNLEAAEVSIRVTDALGRVVYSKQFIAEGSLNTLLVFDDPLNQGVYTIEFVNGSTHLMERFVVQK